MRTDTINAILVGLAIVQVVCSLIASTLPSTWTITQWAARLALALPHRWDVTPKVQAVKPPVGLGVLLVVSCVFQGACAGSFEVSRLVAKASAPKAAPVAPEDRTYCQSLDDRRRTWSGIAVVMDTAGGSSALGSVAAIADKDGIGGPALGVVLAAVGGALVVGGALAHAQTDDLANAWVRECSQ